MIRKLLAWHLREKTRGGQGERKGLIMKNDFRGIIRTTLL